jgi:DUF971 family protein
MTMGSKQSAPTVVPTALTLRKQSRVLEVTFGEEEFSLPLELLRVYSPSAEVRGHGQGQETLQTGMRETNVDALEQVGNYAIQPHFSDGHNTGIYSWDYLYWLGKNQDQLWEDYLQRLEAAGFTRESGRDAPMTAAQASGGGGCASHKH